MNDLRNLVALSVICVSLLSSVQAASTLEQIETYMRANIKSFDLEENLDGLDKWHQHLESQRAGPLNFGLKSLVEVVGRFAEHRRAYEGPTKCTKEGLASILQLDRLLDGAQGDLVRVKMIHRLAKKELQRVCSTASAEVMKVHLNDRGDDESLVRQFTDEIFLMVYSIDNINNEDAIRRYRMQYLNRTIINRKLLVLTAQGVLENMDRSNDPDLAKFKDPKVVEKLMRKYMVEPCTRYIKLADEVNFIHSNSLRNQPGANTYLDPRSVPASLATEVGWARSRLCETILELVDK